MSPWAEVLSKWSLADVCPACSARKKMDAPQFTQTNYLFQQVIIISLKMFNLALPCLRSLLVFSLWLEKGYLFPLCANLLAGLPSICLSLPWQVELSSLTVSHRPWSLSLWWYLLHPCEFSAACRFSQISDAVVLVSIWHPARVRTPQFLLSEPVMTKGKGSEDY